MKFLEVIRIAFSSLKANKLRSVLTILGIVVGIFSIISISTIISMLQNSIESGFSQLGRNTFQIQKYPVMEGGDWERFRNRKDLTVEEFYQLRERLTIAQYVGAEQWQWGKVIKYGNVETNPNVQVTGISPEAQPNNQWTVDEGREINNSDVFRYNRVVILGKDVAEKLFEHIDPIGQSVRVDGHLLQVIGVFEKQGELFGQSRDNFVAMPITTFQGFYGKYNNSINITVTAASREIYDETIEAAIGHLRTIRKVPAGEENDFEIWSNESMLTTIGNTTQYVELGAFVIAAIALIAAGIGIMNIMLVSVTERTREIGIRKAIGARKNNILYQFLIEAIVLCLFGGMVGIILGVGVGNLAGSMLASTPTVPVFSVILGLALCVFVGVTFGTYPAIKASNLDPIEALRYE